MMDKMTDEYEELFCSRCDQSVTSDELVFTDEAYWCLEYTDTHTGYICKKCVKDLALQKREGEK